MVVRLDKFYVGILAAYEHFDGLGALVVEDVHTRFDTSLSEIRVQFLERLDHVVAVSG